MTEALQESLAETLAEIESEKVKRAQALLEGKPVSSAKVNDLQARARAIEDAINIQNTRSRDAKEEQRLLRVQAEQQTVTASFDRLLAAEADAEAAARQLADAISRTLKISSSMCASISRLNGRGSPPPLQPYALATRLSGRISAVMSTIPGHTHRFADFLWRPGMYTPAQVWADDERKLLARHVAAENLQPLETIPEKEVENVA